MVGDVTSNLLTTLSNIRIVFNLISINKWCVFWPAFGWDRHPKAGQKHFFTIFWLEFWKKDNLTCFCHLILSSEIGFSSGPSFKCFQEVWRSKLSLKLTNNEKKEQEKRKIRYPLQWVNQRWVSTSFWEWTVFPPVFIDFCVNMSEKNLKMLENLFRPALGVVSIKKLVKIHNKQAFSYFKKWPSF